MHRIQYWAITLTSWLVTAKALARTGLLALFMALFIGSMPAQAASRISPQLEEQVLQIILNHPEVILESVQAYQQRQQEQLQQAQQKFLQQLKANPQEVIGESPTTGAAESKIVLIEFSDFQCPYCAEAHKTLKQLMATHQDEVTLVYKHFPLTPVHPEAMSAAKAAWAASQQGKFWEYQDALFTQQDKLGEALYVATAKTLNLDLEQFNRDRISKVASAAIQKDIQLAQSVGITGTPFFVMNGETFSGAVELSDIENRLARVSKL